MALEKFDPDEEEEKILQQKTTRFTFKNPSHPETNTTVEDFVKEDGDWKRKEIPNKNHKQEFFDSAVELRKHTGSWTNWIIGETVRCFAEAEIRDNEDELAEFMNMVLDDYEVVPKED